MFNSRRCQVRRFIPSPLSRRSISVPALKYGTVFSSTWTVSWVRGFAPDPSVATPHREGAEPAQLDALAASQSGGDLVEDRRDVSSASAIGRFGLLAASSAISSALVTAGSVLTTVRRF